MAKGNWLSSFPQNATSPQGEAQWFSSSCVISGREEKVAQSCLTATPCYRVHGILQPSILERVAFLISRGSSQPRNRTQVSRIGGGFFIPAEPPQKSKKGVTKLSNQCSNLGGNCCHTSPLHILPESPLLLILVFMSKRILRQKRPLRSLGGLKK